MRRPLCAFCLSALGVLALCSFLPQTGLLLPSAAIFVVFCLLVWWKGGAARGYAVCLLLGALVGVGIRETTDARLAKIQGSYAGQEAVLTAEVESIGRAYGAGRVSAVLRVETVDGEAVRFRVECVSLPRCEAGGRIRGRFALDLPDATQRLGDYADGIALSAEYQSGMLRLGPGRSFRARTARLQAALSRALRGGMAENTGGVLAAMAAGDKSHLSSALRSAYRGAGLSHVLVVSGMHVSILCGEVFRLDARRKKERCYAALRLRAVWKALLALLLVGVTGFTPSVLRAAAAVWVSALGVWLYGPPDTLTSLAVAGIAMTAGSSYAVCDIGFELSFAAVLGTVAGGACIRRTRDAWYRQFWKNAKNPVKRPWYFKLPERLWGLAESVCISVCASAATFPVLVLRGLSVSIWAVVSSVAVLWLIQPMMLLGLGTAFTGLMPALESLHGALSVLSAALTGLLDRWAVWISAKPGAGIYFDTAYAAIVCLVLILLGWLAFHWRVRLRVAGPCILLAAAVSIGLGNALSRDVVHIDLVGSANAPAVVVTQNDTAVVLFRGGASAQNAVENQLARRGVQTVELVADLRTNPKTACTLEAERTLPAAEMAVNTAQKLRCTPALVEMLRTRNGCLVRLTVGNRQFAVVNGTVELAKQVTVQWLLASPAKPDAVQYKNVLALRSYDWMDNRKELAASISLRRHGGLKTE